MARAILAAAALAALAAIAVAAAQGTSVPEQVETGPTCVETADGPVCISAAVLVPSSPTPSRLRVAPRVVGDHG